MREPGTEAPTMVETVFLLLTILMTRACAYREFPTGEAQISAKGEEVWLVDNMQSIFRRNGNEWENIPGWATNVGASPDGWAWVISAHFSIQRWNPVQKIWEVMPGKGYQINAISKDVAVVVGIDYMIYMWKVNGWTKIGQHAIWVAIGEREEVWAVNRYDGSLWQWRYPWLGFGGRVMMETATPAVQIDLQNSARMVYRDEFKKPYVRLQEGDSWQISGVVEFVSENIGSFSIGKKSIAGIMMTPVLADF